VAKHRPIATYYNGGERVAHSTTEEAAIRAAFSRLIRGDYTKAIVYDEYSNQSSVLRVTPGGITTHITNWSKT
jgi:hypothetical protein